MRVAVVTPIPTPYRDPFWERLAEVPDVELAVFLCAAGKADRPWSRRDYSSASPFRLLEGRNLVADESGRSFFWNPEVFRCLDRGDFQCLLVGGYNHPTMWLAFVWALLRGVPFFLMCESHAGSGRRRWWRSLKRLALRALMSRAAGGLPTGSLAQAHLAELGTAAERMITMPNAPDFDALRARAKVAVTSRDVVADHSSGSGFAGAGPSATVLFVGRLIEQKCVIDLLEAFAASRLAVDGILVIVGDGPERAALERRAAAPDLSGRVIFTGFLEPERVWDWYSSATLYVLPSRETWGVSVLEALALGVPVLLSDAVGCAPDVAVAGDAVRVYTHRDVASLRERIDEALAFPSCRESVVESWRSVEARLCYAAQTERLLPLLARVVD